MPEQQLLDYIKKAKDAGQSDEQTRSLLYKNGWTEVEVREAFLALTPAQPQPEPQPQIQSQNQTEIQPQPAQQKKDDLSVISDTIKEIDKLDSKPQPESQPEPVSQIQSQKFQAQPIATVSMPNAMPEMRKKSHAILKTLIVLIILVVLGGAGYFVAGQYVNLPWNPFTPNPQTVVAKMLTNMGKVKTSHVVTQLEVSSTDNSNKTPQGKMNLSADSSIDMSDARNQKSNISIKFDLTSQASASSIASIDANATSVGETTYLKMNSVSLPNNVSYSGFDISQINGRWFKADQDSYNAIYQAENGQSALAITDISSKNNSDLVKKFSDLFLADKLFSNIKQLNIETIGGQDTYHYSATIAKDKLKDLLLKITTLSTSQDILQSMVGSIADSIGDVNVEMWIGKKDYLLYQYKVNKTINLNDSLLSNTSLGLAIKLNVTNSNFNQPITVHAPEGAQKIEEVILPMIKTQKVASNLSRVSIEAESLFDVNKNYYLLCKNGFLNGSKITPYGQTFISVANGVLKLGAKNPKCFANNTGYCVSTQLSDGTYLCVGSGATVGTVNCISAQTICK